MKIMDRNSAEIAKIFDTPIVRYIDGSGNVSFMKWIPPFYACRALTSTAATATSSGTAGDWFHPRLVQASWELDTDYECVRMGGYWVDMYLCSAPDATMGDIGTASPANGYISQPFKVPMVNQTIAHFRQYLKARFQSGSLEGFPADYFKEATLTYGTLGIGKTYVITDYKSDDDFSNCVGVAIQGTVNTTNFVFIAKATAPTKWTNGSTVKRMSGGLMTDAHWFELWIWTRINRWLLHGNTYGYGVSGKYPVWNADYYEIAMQDFIQSSNYGASLTGGGSPLWEIPISDFCGNRWEFTDGFRLYNAGIYTAGKTVNPFTNPSDGYSHVNFTNTGLSISGSTTSQSIASYRTEQALKRHGIAASTVTAWQGGFDGQGWWNDSSGEIISLRGGHCNDGALCPGALYLVYTQASSAWLIGARAVLVP